MSFQEDSSVWQELQDKAWEDLNYRRTNRICARCGTTVWCYIKEITKYKDYVKDCKYDHKKNSIDDQAARNGSAICTSCGGEVLTGKLGTNSERINNNEDYVIDKLTQIRKLCNQHQELLQKRTTLTNRIYKDSHIKWEDEQEGATKIKNTEAELSQNVKDIVGVQSQIDSLVNLSTPTISSGTPEYNDI